MKLSVTFKFSVYISLVLAQSKQLGSRKQQQDAYDPRSCDMGTSDKWACVCDQLGLKRDNCEAEIDKNLELNNLKLCKDMSPYYLGRPVCRSEQMWTQSRDPAGKAMQFALDLFKAADPKNLEKNYVISPLSPQILLAQLIEGCSEDARQEMINGIKLNSKEVSSLMQSLQETANKDNAMNKLDIASIVYKSKNMNLTDEFNHSRKQNKIMLQNIDFSDTVNAVQEINNWVSQKTRGNIQEIVSEQNLSPDMSMMLLNAIYFKGTWRYKFNQTDKRASFHTAENNKMSVQMMKQINRLRFGEINFGEYWEPDTGLRWVELPYEGDQLSMILLLPKTRFELDKNLEQVTGAHLQEIFKVIRRDFNPNKIHLQVPKFTIKDSISLVEPLKKLGVKQIFESDSALNKLSKTPVKVGDVKQDSFLSVDETGTTATAVSKITIIPLSLNAYEDVHFECNEPFMVMIVDKTSEIPLFMGKIRQPLKPTQESKNQG
uniref:Putative serine proteinase inhibitor n=2 Tax=Culex tarsalis TaxID=7177 RepID=A0A1Q3FMG6_CULTA